MTGKFMADFSELAINLNYMLDDSRRIQKEASVYYISDSTSKAIEDLENMLEYISKSPIIKIGKIWPTFSENLRNYMAWKNLEISRNQQNVDRKVVDAYNAILNSSRRIEGYYESIKGEEIYTKGLKLRQIETIKDERKEIDNKLAEITGDRQQRFNIKVSKEWPQPKSKKVSVQDEQPSEETNKLDEEDYNEQIEQINKQIEQIKKRIKKRSYDKIVFTNQRSCFTSEHEKYIASGKIERRVQENTALMYSAYQREVKKYVDCHTKMADRKKELSPQIRRLYDQEKSSIASGKELLPARVALYFPKCSIEDFVKIDSSHFTQPLMKLRQQCIELLEKMKKTDYQLYKEVANVVCEEDYEYSLLLINLQRIEQAKTMYYAAYQKAADNEVATINAEYKEELAEYKKRYKELSSTLKKLTIEITRLEKEIARLEKEKIKLEKKHQEKIQSIDDDKKKKGQQK